MIVEEDQNLQNSEAVLRDIFMNYPYFRFVFRTNTLSRLDILVTYDIFTNTIKVVEKSAIPYPPTPPTEPAAPQE